MLVEKAISPLVVDDKVYYLSDEAPRDVYVYDMKLGTTQVLIQGFDCIGLVYTNGVLYTISDGKGAILRLDLSTNALHETVVEGGASSLSLYDNSLYFFTIYEKGYGYEINLKTNEMKKIVGYNHGDFYFLGMSPTKQYIFFSGSRLVDSRTTKGILYRQERSTGVVEEIAEFPADRFYIMDDDIYIFRDSGTSKNGPNVDVISLDGEKDAKSNSFIATMADASVSQNPAITKIIGSK